ncbi:23S rRNA (uracil(1939)-C(5))-methyltransferase RlmD [Mycoplasmopsis adleri]|uniref:23S rRNA (uracil(1939)-C(5))-methyltransferase RlmD n=1 Tax=Mycoplasmopsis adleri TaxID=51362 RepID=UPI0038734BE7
MKKVNLQVYEKVQAIEHSYQGLGTVKINNFPVFVENLLPGETADILVKNVNSKYADAKVIKLYNKSPIRVDIDNEELMKSGSTALANLKYEDQLAFKGNNVKYLFNRNIHYSNILPILPSSKIWNYRNKLAVFTELLNNKIELGLYEKKTHNLIPQKSYDLALNPINDLLIWIQNNINNYPEIIKEGNSFNQILVKCSSLNDEMLLVFNAQKPFQLPKKFIEDVHNAFPKLLSILIVYKDKIINQYISQNTCLIDKIGNFTFKVNYNSFFQINPYQSNNLYNLLFDNMKLSKDDIVLDAYSGIGTISIMIANRVKWVYGLEIVKEATRDAIENAKLNNVNNVTFYASDVLKTIDKIDQKLTKIIVDPPREGLHPNFLKKIVEISPNEVGYISCNYHTLCRDCDLLIKEGYELVYLRPCDMFSQTHHIEVVAILRKKA